MIYSILQFGSEDSLLREEFFYYQQNQKYIFGYINSCKLRAFSI